MTVGQRISQTFPNKMAESKIATFNIRIFICRQVVELWDLTKMCDNLKMMHMGFICPRVYTEEDTLSFEPRKKGLEKKGTF